MPWWAVKCRARSPPQRVLRLEHHRASPCASSGLRPKSAPLCALAPVYSRSRSLPTADRKMPQPPTQYSAANSGNAHELYVVCVRPGQLQQEEFNPTSHGHHLPLAGPYFTTSRDRTRSGWDVLPGMICVEVGASVHLVDTTFAWQMIALLTCAAVMTWKSSFAPSRQ